MILEVLLANTAAAAGLVVLALLAGGAFHLSPAARHALWLVVLLKLISPVGLVWSVPVPLTDPISLRAAETDQKPAAAENRADRTATLSRSDEFIVRCQPSIGQVAPPAPAADSYAPGRNTVSLCLLIVWLTGAALIAVRYLRRTIRFARYARAGKPASPSLQRQVFQLAAQLGVHAPIVRVLGRLPSPVVWCVFRRMLLWPKGLQDRLSREGRRAVLAHELAHLRRRDHWARWIELAAAALHWWNPIFWLVRRQLRDNAELACDAWVTGTFPDARRHYAEALLQICAGSTRAAAPSPAVGVGGEGRDFQRRLTMIMRDRVPCRLAASAKLFVALLAIAALPAWTLGQGNPKPATVPAGAAGDRDNKGAQPAPHFAGPFLLSFNDGGTGGADTEEARRIKEIEARIADLNKQIQELKHQKDANEAIKQYEKALSDAYKEKRLEKNLELLKAYEAVDQAAAAKLKKLVQEPAAQVDRATFARRLILDLTGRPPTPAEIEAFVKDQSPEYLRKFIEKLMSLPRAKDPAHAKYDDRKQLEDLSRQLLDKALMEKHDQGAKNAQVQGKYQLFRIAPDGKIVEVKADPSNPKGPGSAAGDSPPKILIRTREAQPEVRVFSPDGKAIMNAVINLTDGRVIQGWMVKPDGKEIRVQTVDPKTGRLDMPKDVAANLKLRMDPPAPPGTTVSAEKSISLTRATYKLPQKKAEALSSFLKANIHPPVLEFKIEDGVLTVTTTPDAQATIKGIVSLMRAEGDQGNQLRLESLELQKWLEPKGKQVPKE